MKLAEKRSAIMLRKKGYSIGVIAQKLSVSKASVSNWVCDIELSKAQIKKLAASPYSTKAVENRRISRLKNENARRNKIIDAAINDIQCLTQTELFYLGVALYWGEGTKKKRGVVEFTNSDPKVIQVMMEFLRKVCNVPEEKFKGHLYLHEHLPVRRAMHYWSELSGIPLKQFYKTSVQHNRKRLKKDTLKYGTFAVIVCNTELKLKIMGWIEGTFRAVTGSSSIGE